MAFKVLGRIWELIAIMVFVWVFMLLIFYIIRVLVVPLGEGVASLGLKVLFGFLKVAISASLVLAWLFVWHKLYVYVYNRNAQKLSKRCIKVGRDKNPPR